MRFQESLIRHGYCATKAPLMVVEFPGRNRAGKFDGQNGAGMKS
jgi:hypothetical protein